MCDHHPDQVWERVTTGCQTSSDPCLAATTQGGTGTEVTVQVSLQRLNRVVMDKKNAHLLQNDSFSFIEGAE